MKSMKSKFKLAVPIFNKTCYIFIGEDMKHEALERARKDYGFAEEMREDITGSVFGGVMWLYNTDEDVLVHVSVHLAQHILEDIGSKDSELMAYLVEYIFMNIRKRSV